MLQGELATTRRLGDLHREAAEERQKKVAELEGIVQEFRQHIKVLSACTPASHQQLVSKSSWRLSHRRPTLPAVQHREF